MKNKIIKIVNDSGSISVIDLESLTRYIIGQWSSLEEQREHDHEQLIQKFLNAELKEWIESHIVK